MTITKTKELKKALGIPKYKIAVNEFYNEPNYNTKIHTSKDAYDFLKPLFQYDLEIREVFYLLLLNRRNKISAVHELSKGGIAGTVVDIELIAFMAINSLAKSIILSHNHPSGDLTPSAQDLDITKRIKQALSYFDINILDHIIITNNGYYSFADEGKL